MKRANLWLAGAWATISTLACGGMTQPLGDTSAGAGGQAGTQASPSSNAGSSAGGGFSSTPACETECVQKVFTGSVASCKLCHGKALRAAGLDLESPGLTSRLKDVLATHTDLPLGTTGNECPVGDMLIDTVNPEASWLLKKIRGQQGNCGTAMPQTPPQLTLSDQQCIATYVACVAAP